MFYDIFSSDYDKFVNWDGRLSAEIPFLKKLLQENKANKVLDSACGTGMHLIRLAQDGFEMFGCDYSPKMVEVARRNAEAVGVKVGLFQAGFSELVKLSPETSYDAILCLGNSLPHVIDGGHLKATLTDYFQSTTSGGALIIQIRNFDQVMIEKNRWMEPQSASDEKGDILFHRFYDFLENGAIDFNVFITKRSSDGAWHQQVMSTRLMPITSSLIKDALTDAGYRSIRLFGDLTGKPFDAVSSPNIIAVAIKP